MRSSERLCRADGGTSSGRSTLESGSSVGGTEKVTLPEGRARRRDRGPTATCPTLACADAGRKNRFDPIEPPPRDKLDEIDKNKVCAGGETLTHRCSASVGSGQFCLCVISNKMCKCDRRNNDPLSGSLDKQPLMASPISIF